MSKLPIFEWFYSQGDVLITVNTSNETVNIPAHLQSQDVVDFILGEKPTPKLSIDDKGISASMRFSGSLFACYFPWDAIVQMSGQDAVIQFRNQTAAKEASPTAQREKPGSKSKANLRLVK